MYRRDAAGRGRPEERVKEESRGKKAFHPLHPVGCYHHLLRYRSSLLFLRASPDWFETSIASRCVIEPRYIININWFLWIRIGTNESTYVRQRVHTRPRKSLAYVAASGLRYGILMPRLCPMENDKWILRRILCPFRSLDGGDTARYFSSSSRYSSRWHHQRVPFRGEFQVLIQSVSRTIKEDTFWDVWKNNFSSFVKV